MHWSAAFLHHHLHAPHRMGAACLPLWAQALNTGYQLLAERGRVDVGDFSFPALMDGPVSRMRRKPSRIRCGGAGQAAPGGRWGDWKPRVGDRKPKGVRGPEAQGVGDLRSGSLDLVRRHSLLLVARSQLTRNESGPPAAQSDHAQRGRAGQLGRAADRGAQLDSALQHATSDVNHGSWNSIPRAGCSAGAPRFPSLLFTYLREGAPASRAGARLHAAGAGGAADQGAGGQPARQPRVL